MPAISNLANGLKNSYSCRLRKGFISCNSTKYVVIIKKKYDDYNADFLSVDD